MIYLNNLGFTDVLNAGILRNVEVAVGSYLAPQSSLLFELLGLFGDWLKSEEALQLHAIEKAALAHYMLVWIHPFVDGNGRTSRFLLNLILMKKGFPLTNIEDTDRTLYFETLREAQVSGDTRSFVHFIANIVNRSLEYYLKMTKVNK